MHSETYPPRSKATRRLWQLAAFVLVYGSTVVVHPADVVAQSTFDDSCGQVVPSELYKSDAVTTQVQNPESGLMETVNVEGGFGTAPGSSMLTATRQLGVRSAVMFFASFSASCYVLDAAEVDSAVNGFLDWSGITGIFVDSPPDVAPLAGLDSFSTSETNCANAVTPANFPTPGYVATSCAGPLIYVLKGPDALGAPEYPGGWHRTSDVRSNRIASTTDGGNFTIPVNVPLPKYTAPTVFHTNNVLRSGYSYSNELNVGYMYQGAPRFNNPVDNVNSNHDQFDPYYFLEYRDCDGIGDTLQSVGGVCGVAPGEYYHIVDQDTIVGFMHTPVTLKAREAGWMRRWVVDASCHPVGVTSSIAYNYETWSRVESEHFWDNQPSVRVPVPQCGASEYPTRVRIKLVPKSVPSGTPGTVDQWTIQTVELDPTLTQTATAPDWTACLAADVDCGSPAWDSGTQVCMWGSYALPSQDWCTDLVDPETEPAGPRTNSTVVSDPITLSDPEVSEIDTVEPYTATDPGGGDGGTTVDIEVPIDEGNGTTGIYYEPDTDECWPSGWGWFNPADWVLKPIKCALEWAFIPPEGSLGSFIEDAKDLAAAQFPFSLMFVVVDFLDTTADNASGAAGCIELGMENADIGMDPGCLGLDGTPYTSERSTVATVVVGLLVLSVATLCVGLVTVK